MKLPIGPKQNSKGRSEKKNERDLKAYNTFNTKQDPKINWQKQKGEMKEKDRERVLRIL